MEELFGVISAPTPIIATLESTAEINVIIEGVGINGRDGKTPTRGVDYATPQEIAHIVSNARSDFKEDAAYIHDQIAALKDWRITHNLGKYPSVTVVDSAGNLFIGDVEYVSNKQLIIHFSAAFSGKAYLN